MYVCLFVGVCLSNGWNKGLWGLDGISQESVFVSFFPLLAEVFTREEGFRHGLF